MAELDVLNTFAERAVTLDYCCPDIQENASITIEEGRHPVVEQVIRHDTPFVPNSVVLNHDRRMMIITGPNMGGKSTYMRQTALITLLAHIGSYVPAKKATIGLVDRIFTRIGSSDDLASGRSTFMVEMTETATILQNATSSSLVIMDEIGRGTSTFDGLSLAWACAEHLTEQVKALCLFATHYFELTALPEQCQGAFNAHLSATEHQESIVFLYHIEEGPASQSYGLQVAKLAGVPAPVINKAKTRLQQLEQESTNQSFIKIESHPSQGQLFATTTHPAVELLESLSPDDLSPRESQDYLYKLKALLD